jgi:hypothetical protein
MWRLDVVPCFCMAQGRAGGGRCHGDCLPRPPPIVLLMALLTVLLR